MIARCDPVKDVGRILYWCSLRWLTAAMPFPVGYAVGSVLGIVDFVISGSDRRRRMKRNIRSVLGTARSAAAIVCENLQNHARNNLEFLKYPGMSPANLASLVRFEGREILDVELRKGKGVILATAHFGAKQALQVALGHSGYKVTQIHYHMEADELTWVQKNISQAARKRIEMSIPVNFVNAEGFIRGAYECLRRGEILLVAGDGVGLRTHMTESYVPKEFLGKKMMFPAGMVSLAARTGSSVVPVFAVRDKSRHRIVFEKPLRITDSETETLAEYVKVLEQYVRKYPELWEFWEEFDEENLLADGDMPGEEDAVQDKK